MNFKLRTIILAHFIKIWYENLRKINDKKAFIRDDTYIGIIKSHL